MFSDCKRYSQHNKCNPKYRKCVFLLEKTKRDPYYSLCFESNGDLHVIKDEDRKSCSRFVENKPENLYLRVACEQARKEAFKKKMSGEIIGSGFNEINI